MRTEDPQTKGQAVAADLDGAGRAGGGDGDVVRADIGARPLSEADDLQTTRFGEPLHGGDPAVIDVEDGGPGNASRFDELGLRLRGGFDPPESAGVRHADHEHDGHVGLDETGEVRDAARCRRPELAHQEPRVLGDAEHRDGGAPTSLLNDLTGATVSPSPSRMRARKFFVVVLPLDPVIPMMRREPPARTRATTSLASSPSAATASATTIWLTGDIDRVLHDRQHGAGRDSSSHELVTVGLRAGLRDEDRAGNHRPRVRVDEAVDDGLGRVFSGHAQITAHCGGDLSERQGDHFISMRGSRRLSELGRSSSIGTEDGITRYVFITCVIAFWKADAVAADDTTLVGSSRVTTTTYWGSSTGAKPTMLV